MAIRCSGCTQEVNLHRPIILDGVTTSSTTTAFQISPLIAVDCLRFYLSLVWAPKFRVPFCVPASHRTQLRLTNIRFTKVCPKWGRVADLCTRAGVIGLSLASTRKCRSVKCIEIDKEAKLSFEKTVGRLPKSIDGTIRWHHADTSIPIIRVSFIELEQRPLSWLVGSGVVVVEPPRKGLDPSLVDALRTISLAEKGAISTERSFSKVKNENEPWILRAKEASVQIESKTSPEEGRHCLKLLSILVVDGKASKRIVSHCCPVRNGIWIKPMVLISFLEPRGTSSSAL
ncbi:uncharacterized protein LOC117930044 [Vitis riparia]|uniref:uncharacterized protein LOC117930044 n=1 Tax=Vitis riparia TaxID=96939 RepID=UPI00155B32C0|nr:uncharacterized protein LOC117930044 [Vitis riparia]